MKIATWNVNSLNVRLPQVLDYLSSEEPDSENLDSVSGCFSGNGSLESLSLRLSCLQNKPRHFPKLDVLTLQELKIPDEKFPEEALKAAGYHSAFFGQKTYNGVAILSLEPLLEIQKGMPHFIDEQSRVIAATLGEYRIITAYVPNG